MLANDKNISEQMLQGEVSQLSADEELDAVRELASKAREEVDHRVDPTLGDEIDLGSLLDKAFQSASEEQPLKNDANDFSDEDLLALAQFDDDVTQDVSAGTDQAVVSGPDQSGEAVTDESPTKLSEEVTKSENILDPEVTEQEDLPNTESSPTASINNTASAAQEQINFDTFENIKRAQAFGMGGDAEATRREVGIIQGMSMLTGAGLAALTQMLRSGGATVSEKVNARKYQKLAGEVSTLTAGMDGILNKFTEDGLPAGLKGVKDEYRADFVKEFLARPGNKQLFDGLVQSIGSLSTAATKASRAGADAGLSTDQLDIEVTRKIQDVTDKHKELLNSLHDHSGKKLGDRLNDIVEKVTEMLKNLMQKVADAMGVSQHRPGM